MRNLIKIAFVVFLLLSFFSSFSQEKFEVTGVWVGEIFNDSTQQYIPFELAVSRRNGVLSGYSYTIFTVDGVENIGVKEVIITEKNGKLIVKDRKLIDDNYADRPAKGVYTTFELSHTQNDTADFLNGRWFTNKTRQYYPLSGTASLSKKKRIYETRIVQRLSYLGLANRLSFVSPHGADVVGRPSDRKSEEPMMTIVEPELVIELPKKEEEAGVQLPKAREIAGILESMLDTSTKENPPTGENIQTTGGKGVTPPAKTKEAVTAVIQQAAERRQADTLPSTVAAFKPVVDSIREPVVDNLANEAVRAANQLKQQAAEAEKAKNEAIVKNLATRKVETIQAVHIAGDSIVLSLFDNGVVDGDTVSVLLNGRVIISKVGLLTTAYNHTLHLTPEMGDSLKIILYAENLGSIPPNTGLLVIRDGKKNHEIRFSGDLRNNSAVILLRNREE